MKITDTNTKNRIDLKIMRYEHYDEDWLIVRIIAGKKGSAVKKYDPCLQTVELKELLDAIDLVLDGKTNYIEVQPIEPILSFAIKAIGNYYTFAVSYDLENVREPDNISGEVCEYMPRRRMGMLRQEVEQATLKYRRAGT